MSLEPQRLLASPEMRDAALAATASLSETPVEQRRVLEHLLPRVADDEESLVMVLELAAGIESDVELSEFLAVSAPFVPDSGGAALGAWLDASAAIQNDIERGRALRAILRRSTASDDLTIQVMESAAGIENDFEKAQLLVDMVSHYRKSGKGRAAYQATAATIESAYERDRALAAL
jgi:hypothetical protein